MTEGMIEMMEHRIARKPQARGHTLLVQFDDGSWRSLDLAKESKRGPAFSRLNDPAFVKGVRRICKGFMLEWPDGTTWSADGLWRDSRPVSGDELEIVMQRQSRSKAKAG